MDKPLTEEFFGPQQKNKDRLHTECRVCKKKYMTQWQANKRAEQEVDRKRDKHMYTIKEYTEEEKQDRMREAYAYIYFQAHGRSISKKQLKELEGIEE
jgi:G:T/U-mismatch repair DNA glycosylase